jgi:hypothetical protein
VGVIARKSYLSGQDIGAIEKGRKTTIRREHYRAR